MGNHILLDALFSLPSLTQKDQPCAATEECRDGL